MKMTDAALAGRAVLVDRFDGYAGYRIAEIDPDGAYVRLEHAGGYTDSLIDAQGGWVPRDWAQDRAQEAMALSI